MMDLIRVGVVDMSEAVERRVSGADGRRCCNLSPSEGRRCCSLESMPAPMPSEGRRWLIISPLSVAAPVSDGRRELVSDGRRELVSAEFSVSELRRAVGSNPIDGRRIDEMEALEAREALAASVALELRSMELRGLVTAARVGGMPGGKEGASGDREVAVDS